MKISAMASLRAKRGNPALAPVISGIATSATPPRNDMETK